jgi:predicted secreted hydrolase
VSRRLAALALLLAGLGAVHPTGAYGEEWRAADGPRDWSFPRDHGAHPAYRTEWWYFTGNLTDAGGDPWGYQLTLFRVGVRRQLDPAAAANPWSVRDLYLGHLAVTDGARRVFRYTDRLSRTGPGLAGASTGELDVWLLGWRARMDESGAIRLAAAAEGLAVDLTLRPDQPVVLHGDAGRSRKGPLPGQASYYASLPSLVTAGTVRAGAGAAPVAVTGVSWFDQEFGSNQLAEDQVGWDWFSLHLGDGRELMLYQLRRTDGTLEPASSGTLVAADGSAEHLPLGSFRVEVRDTWVSPGSGARYPSSWRVEVAGHGIALDLAPLLADQELATAGSTGVVYWEGAVTGSGASGPCRGYVELTGYAGALGGLF